MVAGRHQIFRDQVTKKPNSPKYLRYSSDGKPTGGIPGQTAVFQSCVGPGPSQPHLPHPSLIPHHPRELVELQAFQPRGGGKESHNFLVLSQKLLDIPVNIPSASTSEAQLQGRLKNVWVPVVMCLPKRRGFS